MRDPRSEEHTSELQSRRDLVCRLLLEKKKKKDTLSNRFIRCNTSMSDPLQPSILPRPRSSLRTRVFHAFFVCLTLTTIYFSCRPPPAPLLPLLASCGRTSR